MQRTASKPGQTASTQGTTRGSGNHSYFYGQHVRTCSERSLQPHCTRFKPWIAASGARRASRTPDDAQVASDGPGCPASPPCSCVPPACAVYTKGRERPTPSARRQHCPIVSVTFRAEQTASPNKGALAKRHRKGLPKPRLPGLITRLAQV